jgi:YHS domain-containing protein
MSDSTVAAVALSLITTIGAGGHAQQAETPPDALDGVDTVILLTQGKEVFGKSAISLAHDGFTYLFSSPETKAEFQKNPDKYSIQLGGLCARMGGTVTGNPSNYIVHDRKVYIFASDNCRKLFVEAPAKYLATPPPPMPTVAGAVARGRALLDRAAAAHGGNRLDAVNSYLESSSVTLKRPSGDVSIVTKTMWRFPGGARSERTIPLQSGTITVITLLTPEGAWGFGPDGRSRRVPRASVPSVESSLWRPLLPLLRARTEEKLDVAALGPTTVPGASLERVRVIRGGLDVTLNIDSSTGRVHSTSLVDRNDRGEVGAILVAYDDFRTVDGVTLPFAENATFNGAPSPALSRRLETLELNPALDLALFAAPGGAGR